jgi:hypothetical protein
VYVCIFMYVCVYIYTHIHNIYIYIYCGYVSAFDSVLEHQLNRSWFFSAVPVLPVNTTRCFRAGFVTVQLTVGGLSVCPSVVAAALVVCRPAV